MKTSTKFTMERSDHSLFRHTHNFVPDFSGAERRTRIVIGITAVMMVLEITVGLISHSMALLADGWHMSTHVIAFLITAMAYYLSRKHSSNAQFTFGTGKIGVLGGFSSAVVLAMIALLMVGESAHRLFVPLTIHFNEAIGSRVSGIAGEFELRTSAEGHFASSSSRRSQSRSRSPPRFEFTRRLHSCAGRCLHQRSCHHRADWRQVCRLVLARSNHGNRGERRCFFLGLHPDARYQRNSARSNAAFIRSAG